ncbi:MAG: enoyl-CoA hydratase-related protein [Oligoflexia bacterium]|nr:enoyl-CoA hydratase-related protein [Oligoflexia bacterium]
MSYQTLQVKLDDRGVLNVRLNRPEIRNAFNETVIEELSKVFGTEAVAADVKIVVLRGEGPVFCAGGDLNWMKKSVELNFEDNLKDTTRLTQLFSTMNECPKPVIGAIHGAAIGGGVGLVSVCDIAIASSETQFSLSEVRLGIVPACIGPFVIAKIGGSHARGLFISAERFNAARAREIGLIHEVVEKPSDLDVALERLLGNMLQCGPNAMSVAKRVVLDLSWPERRKKLPDCYDYVSRTLAELRISPEGQEGLKAFLEKRKPAWLKK